MALPEGTFKADCVDDVQRTFHRGGLYSKRGFVYFGKARVYGRVVEVYTEAKGYHWVFEANQNTVCAALIAPSAVAAAV